MAMVEPMMEDRICLPNDMIEKVLCGCKITGFEAMLNARPMAEKVIFC
jgi:hypothetical protein